MAYDKKELEEKALKAIELHKIAKVSYIAPYLPCALSTFYGHELEKSEKIKEALNLQKINRKQKLLKRWEESENATLNIAAFKLLADEDELERLNNSENREQDVLKKVIYYDATKGDSK